MSALAFLVIGTVAVVFALLLVLSRNAVHGALCLIVNFAALAVFYLLLGAEFVAIVQVAVYAGAIMVLFLFVLMLLNIQGQEHALGERRMSQSAVAVILGALLLGEIVFLAPRAVAIARQSPVAIPAGFGSPENIGMVLFRDYLLPFEITSFVLLAAMVGAVVLAKRRFE